MPIKRLLLTATISATLTTTLIGCTIGTPPLAMESGIDLTAMNPQVRPQDDFFSYVNGTWLRETPIPADKASYGSFHMLHDKSVKQVRALVESASEEAALSGDRDARIIGDLYQSFMNKALLNERGLSALKEELARIDDIQTPADLAHYFAYADKVGIRSPFGIWVNQDLKEPTQYIVYFEQGGLGLPDREYYFDESEKGRQVTDAYQYYLTQVLKKLDRSDAEPTAAAILKLESRLAEHHWTRVKNRYKDETYNKFCYSQLPELMPNFSWSIYLESANISEQTTFILRQPSYLSSINSVVAQTPLSLWQDYLRVHLISRFAPFLSQEFVELHFNFFSKTLQGIEEQKPRWKRGVALVNHSVGELVGRRYVAKHFPPEAKARMLELVDNLKIAYQDSIHSLDWMSEPTKVEALEKLEKFTTKIGYPNQWRDYSGLEIGTNDLIGNILRVSRFNTQYHLNKLGAPIVRDEWFMTPQTVNAYYNPPMNEIVFPAAILQPPFFNMAAEDAVNYGAIGAVIGHEIGHGFDDQGSKFDGDGQLRNWWSDDDREQFQARTRKLVAQYSRIHPLEGVPINGKLTLGENIGDLAGVNIAYKAYQLSRKDKEPSTIDGFSGEQRFFIGYAQVWRTKMREKALRERLATDPHSPAKFRVLGILPNVDAFYAAFDVEEGDKMYLPEEERVSIW